MDRSVHGRWGWWWKTYSVVHAGERVALNKHLSTHAAVDTGDATVVARAVNVRGSEADRGETRVDLLEVVVVVGDVQLACVLSGVAVGVTDEGALPLLRLLVAFDHE